MAAAVRGAETMPASERSQSLRSYAIFVLLYIVLPRYIFMEILIYWLLYMYIVLVTASLYRYPSLQDLPRYAT